SHSSARPFTFLMCLDVAARELRHAKVADTLDRDPISVRAPRRTRARLAVVTSDGAEGSRCLLPAPIADLHPRSSAEERATPEVRILKLDELVDCQAVNQRFGRMIHG